MSSYETNLASEFYVLSALYRLNADATLSLGNKKSVDITVVRSAGDVVTIDVKAVANKYDWPAGKLYAGDPNRHFLVLLSYEGRFSDLATTPSAWVIPHPDLAPFIKPYAGGMRVLSRAVVKKKASQFKDAWNLILQPPAVSRTLKPTKVPAPRW